ncbi:uridylate kinase [Bradyrhizobium aeschynomenes]|nr:uridylate kinase [Bradyrhizobium aeschynomenes]
MSSNRMTTLRHLARQISRLQMSHPIRMAVDGRTASGKTTLSDELAELIERSGRPVIRTSIDGFHRPKAERYARGRFSAAGYYNDARDLSAVRTLLLEPLAPGGNRLYRTASFDLGLDLAIVQPSELAPVDAVLLVDGTFLQRPELRSHWDVVIFVETSRGISDSRGLGRDRDRLGEQVALKLYAERYGPAFDLYEDNCNPAEMADVVLNNDDLDNPIIRFKTGGRLKPNLNG